jgi:cytidine deaminase
LLSANKDIKKNVAMKEIKITTIVRSYEMAELTPEDTLLIEKAKEATRRSFAPYSKFHVGAAILLSNGDIVCGSNQENAAFSSGTCAERSACYYAGARYPEAALKKLAIAAWTQEGKPEGLDYDAYFQETPISPCGACRQALMEYENMHGPIEVLLYGKNGVYVVSSIADLLPLTFVEF